MAIHDYVIDNQSASAFRSDLNGVLQAVVTQNSNATAPTTTYANMIWYDTANNQLKKRNEANSAWIILGTIDEAGGKFTPNSSLTTAGIAPTTLVTAAETIASNNNDTTIPTSAAVKDYTDTAIAGISTVSTVLLGTLTTTSGTLQTLSGLSLSGYAQLVVAFQNVSFNGGASLVMASALISGATSSNSVALWGLLSVELGTGVYSGSSFTTTVGVSPPLGGVGAAVAGRTTLSTATTSLSFAPSGGFSFDAGSIRVYGVK